MATVPGQGHVFSSGGFKKIKEPGMWACNSGATLSPVKKAWAYHSGKWVQFYPHPKPPPTKPPGGGTHPGGGTTPTTHTVTLTGSSAGSYRWTFNLARYQGRITAVRLIVTASVFVKHTATVYGYPSGGSFGSFTHAVGSHTASKTLPASAFNGSTRGVRLDEHGGITSISRVQLRITYR